MNRKKVVHIVWYMNKLCKKEFSDEIIVQVSFQHYELFIFRFS